MHRRSALLASLLPWAAGAAPVGEAGLRFPADFGAHPASRTEWWYVTGRLVADRRAWGFQVTFFRSATGLDEAATFRPAAAGPPASSGAPTAMPRPAPPAPPASPTSPTSPAPPAPPAPPASAPSSRFAPTQLVFAHAALTDLAQRRLRHDQRIARSGFGIAAADTGDTRVVLRDWALARSAAPASRYLAKVASDAAGFALALRFDATQPVLLQGEAGLSRKGPGAADTSRYYSEPQLAASGTLVLEGRPVEVTGRAWLDHEWSDAFVPAGAVGWDWIGMNLDDGAALTAFRLRRADGSALYAGGSFRRPGGAAVAFAPGEVVFAPGRMWESPSTRARYPVEWRVETPAGRFAVRALLDAQELDSRGSTGSVYWEGLSALLDPGGRAVGSGYLEMTGYADRLRL